MSMKSTTDVSPTDEGMAMREHSMPAPVGGARGDGSGRRKYGVPRLATKCEGHAPTGIGGATHGDGDGETNGGAVESVVRKHVMASSVGGANEGGDDVSNRGALGSTTEHKYCATAGLGGAAHGDGDDEPSSSAYRSTAESIAYHENYATSSLVCGTGTHGDGDNKTSKSATTNTSPASQSWMDDASFLHSKLVRHLS
jgi:hypothetical protein